MQAILVKCVYERGRNLRIEYIREIYETVRCYIQKQWKTKRSEAELKRKSGASMNIKFILFRL
jgi:hypothetical protein